MSTFTKTFAKGGIATAAVGALALAGAVPAQAKDRDHNKIDAGDVVAGALIIGGLAAILGSSKKNQYDDRYSYRDRDYRPRGNSERAIRKCVRAVERDARRAGYRFANVTEIRDVDRERRGWEVKGRLVVDESRGYRHRVNYDDRRGHYRDRNFDRGRFKCEIRRGQVVDVNYRGLRYLN